MVEAIEVFLMSATNSEPSGATTVRNAWGSTMVAMTWVKVRPRARAASAWPAATLLIPLRTASATKALV